MTAMVASAIPFAVAGGLRRWRSRSSTSRPATREEALMSAAVRRHPRLLRHPRQSPAPHLARRPVVPGREGRADRRARTGQAQFGRGAPARRRRQSRQVALPGDDEPRAAHAAQRDPRLFRGDEGGAVRPARRARVQGLLQRHPFERPAPADADQRNPRPVARRGGALRAEGGIGVAARRRRGMPPPPGDAGQEPQHHGRRGARQGSAAHLGGRARGAPGDAQSA